MGASVTPSPNGNDVLFEDSYRSLADNVPRDQLDGYLHKIDQVRQDDWLVFISNDHAPANQGIREVKVTPGSVDEVIAKAAALVKDGHATGTDSGISTPPLITLVVSLALAVRFGWRASLRSRTGAGTRECPLRNPRISPVAGAQRDAQPASVHPAVGRVAQAEQHACMERVALDRRRELPTVAPLRIPRHPRSVYPAARR
jgi:hypothetical protein